MERFLFDRAEYDRLYNCTEYDVEQIPLSERRHLLLGISIVALCVGFTLLYLPSMVVMLRQLHRPAYKIMFLIGLMDIGMLSVIAAQCGVMSILGDMFCSHRNWHYIHGSVTMDAQSGLGKGTVPRPSNTVWLGLSLFHFVMADLYDRPVIWNPIYTAHVFNPHAGYLTVDESNYSAPEHQIHNAIVFFLLIALYALFLATLAVRRFFGRQRDPQGMPSRGEWKMFVQILLICSCTATAAGMYLVTPIIPGLPPVAFIVGSFAWIFSHGMPAFVYLTMNPSMRQELRKLMGIGSNSVGPTTVRLDATVVGPDDTIIA